MHIIGAQPVRVASDVGAVSVAAPTDRREPPVGRGSSSKRREHFWTAVIADERYRDRVSAVAEVDGTIVGLALAGPPSDEDAAWAQQLYALYTYVAYHGSGAGSALLAAVLDPRASAGLWVADPNPRAQAFYRKHGFVPDGTTKVDHGVHELRMVRPGAPGIT
ncbi:GNAT family N-acetyltransferase [Cellulomonas composti]|uniref:N-acetyltransferase domain-containing protein n=1 Tax=Cellulomonas composti TaxID=266130 RepID=A0A511J6C1_9CELL|nr:GNAT family N-acetyltransferase [Cellulomonas composti]GEL93545.1 hypothetical protein CCO02nite_02030 [Cellulomonas composti]